MTVKFVTRYGDVWFGGVAPIMDFDIWTLPQTATLEQYAGVFRYEGYDNEMPVYQEEHLGGG